MLTRDIDTLQLGGDEVQAAVDRVARARQWPSDWLNDAANMWASHFDTPDDWTVHLARGGESVCVARPQLLLAMKHLAGRGRRDTCDTDVLLDVCGIESIDQAMAVFNRCYPTESIAPKALAQVRERLADSSRM